MNVRLVKLVSGEEIICEFDTITKTTKVEEVTFSDDFVLLKNAVQLGMDQSSGKLRLIPYPMIAKADEVLEVNRIHIMFDINVSDNCKEAYCKQYNKIIEPTNELIL